jgi:hypothetical protein
MVDSARELMQIFSLIICLIAPTIVNLAEIVKTLLGDVSPTIENAIYYYLMTSGNWPMGFIIALYVLFRVIRKSNKEKTYNKGNIYHNKPYWWYWMCSKILGYEKCNLILVPIYTQYKLILRDTFEEYPFEESVFPQKECQINVEIKMNETNPNSKDINLIIQDTYPISYNQIPSNFKTNTTISVKRDFLRFGERVHSKELVDTVVEEIRKLSDGITLNIFSTTNPKNTFEIVKKAISLAERGNVKHVNVFQQNSDGERTFANKPHRVM